MAGKRKPEAKAAEAVPKKTSRSGKKTAAGSQPAQGVLTAVASGAAPHLLATSQAATHNGGVMSQHLDNVRLVHKEFGPNFEQEEPPTSSFLRAFEEKAAISDLRKFKKHTCLINAAWLDPSYSPCPSIPLVWRTVEQILGHFFQRPQNLSDQKIEVAVLECDVQQGRFPNKGSWRFTSAEEPVMAIYQAISSAIQARHEGEGKLTDEELRKMDDVLFAWREALLQTQVDVIVVDSESELQWMAQQYRENIKQRDYLTRTPVQRIFDLQSKMAQLGPHASTADVLALYNKNLKLSTKSEALSENFIDQADSIYKKAFVFPEILEIIMAEEEFHSESLFNGVSKLFCIVSKAATREEVHWVVASLHHLRLSGEITHNSSTAYRILQGTAKEHNQGLVDVLLYQNRVRSHLLCDFDAQDQLHHKIRQNKESSSHKPFKILTP